VSGDQGEEEKEGREGGEKKVKPNVFEFGLIQNDTTYMICDMSYEGAPDLFV
jgi:hypothetical protein